MKTGIKLIAEERLDQFVKNEYTLTHDQQVNSDGQLIEAAQKLSSMDADAPDWIPPKGWDTGVWEYMIQKPHLERLAIAGALLAAEIDRIQSLKKVPMCSLCGGIVIHKEGCNNDLENEAVDIYL